MKTVQLKAPVTGKVIPLAEVPDQVFAGGLMGDGVAFIPEDNTITAPCDGTITMIAETLHAVGIQTENGAEILIHVGLDTVNLGGSGFTMLVEADQKVKQGEPLLKVDVEYLKENNINLTTPMIVTNSADYNISFMTDSSDGIVMACDPKETANTNSAKERGRFDMLAERITDLIGGSENVAAFTHCVTRLRFTVKNKDLVKTSEIEEIENVVGCNWAGSQLQIIIGQSVGDAYQKICEMTSLGKSTSESVHDEKQKFSLSVVLDYITGSIAPVLPALIGCGMLKVLILVLEMCGLLTPGVGTDQMITFAADATFYFLPLLVARGAAKKLNANESIAMVIGGMLVYPSFSAAVAEGTAMSFLGIPVYAATYSCALTAIIGGVTEPGLYGVTLKYKTPLISAMVGGFAGGCIAGLFNVYVRAFYGSAGIFAIPSFISDNIITLVWFIAALIISMIVTFILTCILYKDER